MNEDDALIAATQRAHLRRILLTFLIVVLVLPLVGFGGRWALLLPLLIIVAAWGSREALLLRRSVRTHGARRMP